ncbi:MAG: TonB-dependent receptor [Bacteroidota bacterium]
MRRPLLYTVLLFACTKVLAQSSTLSGYVTQGEGGSPLIATVYIQSLNLRTETDSTGYYELAIPLGRYDVEVFSLGMKKSQATVEMSEDLLLDFQLEALSENLEAIEITGEKTETIGLTRLNAVDGVAIYEAKKNEVIVLDDFAANRVSNNARQVFAKVPGLNIWESDCAGLQLDIAARGLGPSRTAHFNTRQNGYDMSADALGYPESYYIPALQAVDRIEVVRGAASLQYGTQFGGMLNFKLKEAPDKPFELTAEQAIGSFGLLNSFVSVGGTVGELDYYGYYQYRTGDCWRDNSCFDSHLAFGRMGYQASDKLKIGFEYSLMDYTAQQPGGLTDDDFASGDLTQSRRARNWFQVSWNLLASTIDYRFSERTQLNIRTFGLLSRRNALGNLVQIGVPDNPNEERTLIRDDFRNFGAEARLLHRFVLLGKPSALVAGARYYNGSTERIQGAASADSSASFRFLNPDDPEEFDYLFPSSNYAVFLENLLDITPRLSLTTGIRWEYIRTDSDGVWKLNRRDFAGNLVSSTTNTDQTSERRNFPLWGIGASYYLTDELNLYSNYSTNFRSITFSDLRVVNPNFQLDSLITDENGFNADLGIRGKLLQGVNVDISVFLMRYNDRIGQYELPGSTTLFRTNIGDSRHIGIESYVEFDVLRLAQIKANEARLSLFVNLSATRATYIRSDITAIQDRRVEYVPNIMLRTGLNYAWKGLKATYQFSYLGEQFSDATNSIFNPNALTGIIPSYHVMDLSLEYQLDRYKLTAGVNNLTDQQYFTRRAESYPGPGIIPATPRSFYLSLGFTL